MSKIIPRCTDSLCQYVDECDIWFVSKWTKYRFLLCPQEQLRSIVMSASVCVCLFVCPQGYLRNHTCDLYQIFAACCLWPWPDPPPASLQYVMYFRFCGWRQKFSHNVADMAESNRTLCFIEFARWRYRGKFAIYDCLLLVRQGLKFAVTPTLLKCCA